MKAFKKIVNWLHLWLGLATGIILIIVALTGSILTFEDELEPVLFKHSQVVTPAAQRLSIDSLVQVANQVYPDKKLTRLILPAEADRSAEARIGDKGKGGLQVAYLNPYTGEVLYKGVYNEQFFQQVRSLHRYLFLGATGKIITGISCSVCLFLVISGLVLWWPANKHAIKQRFKIKWNASGKRLTWDLHAVSGFYIAIFLLLITITGFVWSYDWAEKLIYKLADGKLEKPEKIKNITKKKKEEPGIYQAMFDSMNKLYPQTGQVAFNMPAKPALAVTLQKELEGSSVRHIDAAYFDGHTGAFIKQIPYGDLTTGAKIRRVILPIHTGALLGWPTKLLYLIVSLFTASLPITGFLVWLGKNRKKPRKLRHPKHAIA